MRRLPSDAPIGRDEIDWDELFRLHAPRLRRRVARRVPDPAIVEDVVQETFIQAYRRWATYDQFRPLWPWLVAISVNLAWRWSQASHQANEAETAETDELAEAPLLDYFAAAGSDEHVANLDRRKAMRTALDGMTAKHRRILLRWELGHRSVADLAAAEGLTPEELRATVVRARRSLRRRFLAASGEGTFGWVAVGSLGAVLGRWRDRITRAATTSGWAEAAGSLAAAPVLVAGVAMFTLVPAPSPDARLIGSVTEQPSPAAVVDDGPNGAAAAPSAAASPASTTGRSTTASTVPPLAPAPTPVVAAGPASAHIARTPDSHRTSLTLNGANGTTKSNKNTTVHCEKGVLVGAICRVQELVPE